MKSKPTKYAAAIASLALAASSSQAATITWGSATTISSSTDVSTAGTAVYATYFSGVGAAPATAVVNGVTFDKQGTGTGNITITTGIANASIGTGSVTDTAYQKILDAPWYDIETATLTGLTNGQQYQVQVWSQDPRYNNATVTTISGGPSLAIDSDFGSASSGFGQFAIGTFTASGTTQDIAFGDADNGIVNAISLRAIPEPSAALLGGIGMLCLLRRRRA